MRFFLCTILIILATSCNVAKYQKSTPEKEFRGVWIATVVNIDWPKNGNDATEKQQRDFVKILDFYKNLNFNAAIVQIRTAGDAFYPTTLAPWSRYLTGTEGTAPKKDDDPLVWLISETHKRGMEFHAWLNPYRATFNLDTLALAATHDYYKHPDWMIKYGKKYYYDPGIPKVQDKFTEVVREIVSNYKIDAIHFDDYFYPYKTKGEKFSDSLTFTIHRLPNQKIGDWRRSNVDSLVKKVQQTIKETKPWVQFGISPFGVWKNKRTDPKGSETEAGQTTYEDLYADPLLWVEKGWLDYLAPQAYWSLDHPKASHRKITQWWADTVRTTNLYMGNGAYKIKNNADKAWKRNNEIPKQLLLARKTTNVHGNIFFSAKSLMGKHRSIVKKLGKIYATPVKTPSLPVQKKRKIDQAAITSLTVVNGKLKLCITHNDALPRSVLYYRLKDVDYPKDRILIRKNYLSEGQTSQCDSMALSKKGVRKPMGIAIIDAYGNESELQILNKN